MRKRAQDSELRRVQRSFMFSHIQTATHYQAAFEVEHQGGNPVQNRNLRFRYQNHRRRVDDDLFWSLRSEQDSYSARRCHLLEQDSVHNVEELRIGMGAHIQEDSQNYDELLPDQHHLRSCLRACESVDLEHGRELRQIPRRLTGHDRQSSKGGYAAHHGGSECSSRGSRTLDGTSGRGSIHDRCAEWKWSQIARLLHPG